MGAGLGPSLIRRVGENKGECLGRAEAWVLRAASLPHSIAQNAIEWGTPMVWATRLGVHWHTILLDSWCPMEYKGNCADRC